MSGIRWGSTVSTQGQRAQPIAHPPELLPLEGGGRQLRAPLLYSSVRYVGIKQTNADPSVSTVSTELSAVDLLYSGLLV